MGVARNLLIFVVSVSQESKNCPSNCTGMHVHSCIFTFECTHTHTSNNVCILGEVIMCVCIRVRVCTCVSVCVYVHDV